MDERFLEELKSKIDLVEIVKKYSDVKKSGKNYMCRSPFRNERTPSFSISTEKGLWYDFGASEGGDSIKFIEKIENMSFMEAINFLAESVGMTVPKTFGAQESKKEEKNYILEIYKSTTKFFQKQLINHEKAQTYLSNRKISREISNEWQLGYGGDKKDELSKFLLSKGFSSKEIEDAGVAFSRDFSNNQLQDRFWGRIIIPIINHKNNEIVAFSGRDILSRENTGKYINSPEHTFYHKSSLLFGLDKAIPEIKSRDSVILVEGNFDTISAHTCGFKNTVATCGTSLTDTHLQILSRYTKNFLLAFDNDLAGKKATLKGVEMCLKLNLEAKIINIVEGKDFDDLAQNNPDKLKEAVAKAENAMEFLFHNFGKKYLNQSLEGEKIFLDKFFFFVNLLSRPIERDTWLERIAKKLNRKKEIIEQEFARFSANKRNIITPKIIKTKIPKYTRQEHFIGFLLTHLDFFREKITEKILNIMVDNESKEIFAKLLDSNFDKELLDNNEKNKILAWEMMQAQHYQTEVSETILLQDFKNYSETLAKETQKIKRQHEAEDLRKSLFS